MKLQIVLTRTDNGCEPVIFEETKFDSISLAREQFVLAIEKFNQWADATNQVRLKVNVAIVPPPEEQKATPNPRELERLNSQPKKRFV